MHRRTAEAEAGASAAAAEDSAAAAEAAAAAAAPSWKPADAAYFSVRDRGYRKSKAKVPSAASLYEAIEIATFRFDAVEGNVAPRVFAGAVPPTYRNLHERVRRQRAGEALDAADTTAEEAAHLDHLIETLELDPAQANGLPLLMVVNVRRQRSVFFSIFLFWIVVATHCCILRIVSPPHAFYLLVLSARLLLFRSIRCKCPRRRPRFGVPQRGAVGALSYTLP